MSYMHEIFQPDAIAFDLFQLLTDRGRLIGSGISRHVYPYGLDPKRLIIKFEQEENHQNVMEWQIWQSVQYTDLAKWFAPVKAISPCGRILIQHRTKPYSTAAKLPNQIPAFFSDVKMDNWGMLKGEPVCHDYGYNLMLEKGMTKRMKNAYWH